MSVETRYRPDSDGNRPTKVRCPCGYLTDAVEVVDEHTGKTWYVERIVDCPRCDKGRVISIWRRPGMDETSVQDDEDSDEWAEENWSVTT